jgi:two-component system, LytTR family, sensor kinase
MLLYGEAMREFRIMPFTLDPLRSSRNALFWLFHCAGWSAYAITQFFGALLYEKPTSYRIVIATAAIAGFILTLPFRLIFRKLWGRSPWVIITGVLATCYFTALALRAMMNLSYEHFVEPMWEMKTRFEIFGGALSSMYLLLCWAGLYFGIKYYESLQQQREAALKAAALAQEAQLKMLRYQLNPHFLFNTLNAISTLILDNQNYTANRAVTRLADFLRYTLDQDPMKKVTLRQELEALDLYLGTERLRFGERLRLHYAMEERALEGLVPSLLLQPLIENALKYAVSPREGGGSVRIEGRQVGTMLEIVVSDDGPGINDGPLPEKRGVGLRNTRERLAVLYGEQHCFKALNGQPGLRIEMAFPMERAQSESGAPPEAPQTAPKVA